MPLGFRIVRSLVRLLLALFYRRIEVAGRIPLEGPLIVAANHHNSIVDAMILLAVSPRPLRTLAKAQLFTHPLIGPFLKLLGALPVHRRREAGDDPRKNEDLFAATTATLREGGAILIFPEGVTQPEPRLMELRTGAARMLLAAEPADVTLLPVGLGFQDPGTFREGRALVQVGEPVPVEAARALARSDPAAAARALTEDLAEALKTRIVEAPDLETLHALELAEVLWAESHAAPTDAVARAAWLRAAEARRALLQARAPGRVEAFASRLKGFAAALAAAGLRPLELERRYSMVPVLRFVLREGFALLVGAPLALAGLLLHGLPYWTTALAVRLIPHTAEEDATDKIAAGLLFYPLFWTLEAWALARFAPRPLLWAFLALLAPAGFFALAWRDRLARIAREARAFLVRLRDPGRAAALRSEKLALQGELEELAALAEPSGGAP